MRGIAAFGFTAFLVSSASAGALAPRQSDLSPKCTYFAAAARTDTCQSFVNDNHLTLDTFKCLNPSAFTGSDCNLIPGNFYCLEWDSGRSAPVCGAATITSAPRPTSTRPPTTTTTRPPTTTGRCAAIPGPTQSGIKSCCTKYAVAQPGDYCQKVVDAQGGSISLSQFLDWNPAVGTSCGSMLAGYAYCVATTGTPAAPPPTGAPSPLQAGTTADCRAWFKVNPGDICADIERMYNISEDNFFAWNSGIRRDCTNMIAGNYICIGV